MTRVTRLVFVLAFGLARLARGADAVSATVSVPAAPAAMSATAPEAAAPAAVSATPAAVAPAPTDRAVVERLDRIEEALRALHPAPAAAPAPEPVRPVARAPAPAAVGAESPYPEVVVRGARPETSLKDLPVVATVIPADRYPQVPGANAGDAVVAAGVAEAQGSDTAEFSQVNLRGYGMHGGGVEDSQVAVLIDGRPAGTANLAKLPLDAFERIEVVPGGGSALFGTSAMGGAINLVPARGRGEPAGVLSVSGGDGALRRLDGSWGGETGALDFRVDAGRLTSGGFRAPDVPTAVPASMDRWDGAFNLGWTFLPGQRLGLSGSGQYGERMHNPGASYPTGYPYFTFAEDPGTYYRKRYQSAEARLTGSAGPLGWVQTVYDSQDRDVFHTFASGTETDVYASETVQLGGQHLVTWEGPAWGSAVAGFEWSGRAAQSTDADAVPFLPRSRTRNLAGLAEGRLAAPGVPVTLSAGVREDRFTQSIAQPDEGLPIPGLTGTDRTWNATTGRVGAVASLAKWRLHAAVDTGFRAPAAYQLVSNFTQNYPDGFGDVFVSNYAGNSALKPERSVTTEAGLGVDADGTRADVTVFATRLTDHVQQTSTPETPSFVGPLYYIPTDYTWANVDGVTLEGLEGTLELPLAVRRGVVVTPYATGTYHVVMRVNDRAEIERIGSQVPLNIARWFGTAGVRLSAGEGRAGGWAGRVAVQARGIENQQDFNYYAPSATPAFPQFPTLRPYDVWTVEGRYWLSDRAEVFATAANLTDVAYANVLDYPRPGTTVTGGVRVTF